MNHSNDLLILLLKMKWKNIYKNRYLIVAMKSNDKYKWKKRNIKVIHVSNIIIIKSQYSFIEKLIVIERILFDSKWSREFLFLISFLLSHTLVQFYWNIGIAITSYEIDCKIQWRNEGAS